MQSRDHMLDRVTRAGVTLVAGSLGGVRFGFTERTGGVSREPYASLNLGTHVGDDPACVEENRRRVLAALDAAHLLGRLIVPNQVHGYHVAIIRSADELSLDAVRAEVAQGADAVVCTAPAVPVMLCFADCVPIVLAVPDGFAVVHSGWKGTIARIARRAAEVLAAETGRAPHEIRAWIGPHILGDEYEVSQELIERFRAQFSGLPVQGRMLDLSWCIRCALIEAGVRADAIWDCYLSTVRDNERFFSFRAEDGTCGRHGAVAVLAPR